MKINNIQSNINNSFKRVIKVEYQQNPDLYKSKYTVKKGITDLENTLNGKPSIAYSKKEQKELIRFFKGFLEDTHRRSPLKFRHLPNIGYVLLTDEDAIDLQNWEKYLNNKNFIQKKNRKAIEIEEKILSQRFTEKLEDGVTNNPKTTLKISASSENPSDKINFSKIDTFSFYEIQPFYTSIQDGHIVEKLGEKTKPTKRYNTKNVAVKGDFLTLA